MNAHDSGDLRGHNAPIEERISTTLRELADCSIATLRAVRLAEGAKAAAPDKIGILIAKVADAMKAATDCLIRLTEIARPDVTPARGKPVVLPPFADTLAAIRRARKETSS